MSRERLVVMAYHQEQGRVVSFPALLMTEKDLRKYRTKLPLEATSG